MTDYTKIIEGLVPKLDGESAVRHRSALVDAVNADGTVDLDFNGTIISGVSVLAGASVAAGSVVQVLVWAGDMLVIGGIGGPGYALFTTVYYTTNDTFDKADYPGLKAVKAKCQGSGGGGGGAATTGAGQNSIGQTGAGGAYAERFVLESSLGASETVTVGAGGTGAAAGGNGGNGNTSSFGAHCSAAGGAAGGRTGPAAVPTGVAGKSPTITGTGDLVIPGSGSQPTRLLNAGIVFSCYGGGAHLGAAGGVDATATGANGGVGAGFGSGGVGGINAASQGTARTGGAGAPGLVIVEVYV